MKIFHVKERGKEREVLEKIVIIAMAIGVVCVTANNLFMIMQIRKLAKKIENLRKVAELHQTQIEELSKLPSYGLEMYKVIWSISQIQQSQLELIKRLL